MLSSTYVRVAMQVENDRFRQELVWLESQAESVSSLEDEDDSQESLFQVISRFRQQRCCSRRIERHFLPELRKLAWKKSRQMAEHDALHQFSVMQHASVCRLLDQLLSGRKERSRLLKKHIRGYCHTMMQMLEAEENFVFSLACERFSNENWIYLAGVFMREASGDEGLLKCEAGLPDSEKSCLEAGVQYCRKAENRSDAFQCA